MFFRITLKLTNNLELWWVLNVNKVIEKLSFLILDTRCMTGSRLTVQGFTAFDNAFPSICPPNTPYCVRYVYDQAIENNGESLCIKYIVD